MEAALRWIEHRPSDRRRHVFEVLGAVRLSLLGAPALDRALSFCCDASLRVALRNHRADLVINTYFDFYINICLNILYQYFKNIY